VFTARYALSPYIKQIRSVFKGLNFTTKLPSVAESAPCDRVLFSGKIPARHLYVLYLDLLTSRLFKFLACKLKEFVAKSMQFSFEISWN
jgi:hypothetical protein